MARLPKQRLIEPQEIAKLIAFLLTPHSRVLHGAVLDASMGLGGRPGLMTEMAPGLACCSLGRMRMGSL